MVRRWVANTVVGLSCIGTVACNTNSTGGSGNPPATAKTSAPVDTGSALYKAEPAPKLDTPPVPNSDIVVPNAVVRLDLMQTVPAQVDGYVAVIGTPLPKGAPYDQNDKLIILARDTNEMRAFRRLQEGDRVVKGQVVCMFDDIEIMVQIESSQKIILKSEEAIVESKKGAGFIREQITALMKYPDATSKTDLLNAQATLSRYSENVIQSEREMARAVGDEKRGWALMEKHRAKSVVNGVITKIIRQAGSYAKAGEPVMEILSTDEMIVEGNLDSKDADLVQPGMKVVVEPSVLTGPDTKFGSVDHRLAVTGVAVSAHPGQPLIVSSSADGTARVWNAMPADGKPRAQMWLAHPVGVRSVACTGPKATRHLIATGGDDGKLRLWDAKDADKISDKPTKECDDAHASAITSIAFSPDGKYAATVAGRDVWIWSVGDLAAVKKLYALPAEHKDIVTTARFTPQATLVTAARDKAVRIWTIGDKGAAVAKTIDHRKGNVDSLGISRDGSRMLFDQDDSRIDVIGLSDGRPVGSVQNAAAAARFATFAAFSSDDSLVLTAAADGDARGELQLWSAPQPGGRASERRRLVTPGRASPTCAAFSTDADKKFVVVGTASGGVHLWTKSTVEATRELTGQVTSRLRLDNKTVKVQVRAEAPAGGNANLMLDKGSATIIIKAGEMVPVPAAPGNAAAPAPATIVRVGGVAAPGNIVPASGFVNPIVTVPPAASLLPNVAAPSPSLTAPVVAPEKK